MFPQHLVAGVLTMPSTIVNLDWFWAWPKTMASLTDCDSKRMKLSFVDVRKAYFNSTCTRDVYIKLPPKDVTQNMCGKLIRCMYGTRDAASRWGSDIYAFDEEFGI